MEMPDIPRASNEADLLLRCARLDLRPADRVRILQLLEQGLDWPCLLRMASIHGLRPLLYRHLNALAPAAVPKPIFVELWGCHEYTSRRNRRMASELHAILQLLDSRAIPAIPYKGPALAVYVYGDVALREFGDLDILVRPRDILPAQTLLRSLGYHPDYVLTAAVEKAFLRSPLHYHLVLRHAPRSVMVELHWRTDADYPVEPADDRWWTDLESADLEGRKVRRFADRELMLLLCLHGTKHYWASLGWLVDVAELIRRRRIEWDWINARAQELACERRLAIGLYLAQQLLDAPLPEEVTRRIALMPEVRGLALEMAGPLLVPEFHPMSTLGLLRMNLRLYERFGQKLSHLFNVIASPSLVEWTRWPLPRPLFALYLPLRLVRLAGKYISKARSRT